MTLITRHTLVLATAWLLAAGAATLASPAHAQNRGDGSITFNGTQTVFRLAYAVKVPIGGGKSETTIILTDKPLSARAVTDKGERSIEAQAENITMLELEIDSDKEVFNVRVVAQRTRGTLSVSNGLKASFDVWSDKLVQGRVTAAEQAFGSHRISFDARFVVAPTDPKQGKTDSKAAWSTPQGKVLAEYLRAGRAGDKAAIRRVLIADRAQTLDGPNAADFLEYLKTESVDPATATLDSLTIDGNTAVASITGRTKDMERSRKYPLRKVGDAWFVAP